MDLSVVVPVLNEQDNVAPLIGEIRAALNGVTTFEIIYVDDGSTDRTSETLREIARDCPELRILRHATACGQSRAIVTGIQAAHGRWIATLDGDGQNDPADIPLLLATMQKEDADSKLRMIAGWRNKRNDTWLRRLSSKVANSVRAAILADNTPDTGCGLKLFSREVFLTLPYFDHMHRYLPALILRAGWQVRSLPVNHRSRERGQSKYGLHNRLWVGIVDLFGVSWLIRRATVPVIEEIQG